MRPCQKRLAYSGRVYVESNKGKKSKKYIERYLDATKSNMLFAKGIIFVEGLAEQLLIPYLTKFLEDPFALEYPYAAIISLGGLTFKHFLPRFGVGTATGQETAALKRWVACLVDADPARKGDENDSYRIRQNRQ